MENNQLFLPEGLPLEPSEPVWLSESWPMSTLDSGIGSLVTVIISYILIAAAFFLLSLAANAFLPRLKKLVRSLFIILGTLSLVASGMSLVSWNREQNIGDHAMGVEVLKVSDWLSTKGVNVDNRVAWDLVCEFYKEKNIHCRDQRVSVKYKGQQVRVNLQRVAGQKNVALYNYEELIPLVQ